MFRDTSQEITGQERLFASRMFISNPIIVVFSNSEGTDRVRASLTSVEAISIPNQSSSFLPFDFLRLTKADMGLLKQLSNQTASLPSHKTLISRCQAGGIWAPRRQPRQSAKHTFPPAYHVIAMRLTGAEVERSLCR